MKDMREQFRPIAEETRRQTRRAEVVLGSIFAIALASWFMRWTAGFLIAWTAMASFILFAVVHAAAAQPVVCPGCSQPILTKLGPHCPECGEQAVRKDGWFRHPECAACGKALAKGRKSGRRYKIKSCTHCGCRLDDIGI